MSNCQDQFSTENTKVASDEIHGFVIAPGILVVMRFLEKDEPIVLNILVCVPHMS